MPAVLTANVLSAISSFRDGLGDLRVLGGFVLDGFQKAVGSCYVLDRFIVGASTHLFVSFFHDNPSSSIVVRRS
jgi:hypothetical protein